MVDDNNKYLSPVAKKALYNDDFSSSPPTPMTISPHSSAPSSPRRSLISSSGDSSDDSDSAAKVRELQLVHPPY